MFYLLYTVRIALPMLVAVSVTSRPVFVSTFAMLISILMVLYLSIMRPFSKTISLVQTLLIETIVLVLSICVLLLTLFDANGTGTTEMKLMLGDLVILGNDVVNVLIICFFFIRCWQEASAIIRTQRAKTADQKDRTALLQVLGLFVQQSNMGFEELIDDDDSTHVSALRTKPPLANRRADIKRTLMPNLPPSGALASVAEDNSDFSAAIEGNNSPMAKTGMNPGVSQLGLSQVMESSPIRNESRMSNNSRLKSRIFRPTLASAVNFDGNNNNMETSSPNMAEVKESSLLLPNQPPNLNNIKGITRMACNKNI